MRSPRAVPFTTRECFRFPVRPVHRSVSPLGPTLDHFAASYVTGAPRQAPFDRNFGLERLCNVRGLRYRGVDLTQEMVEAARTRLAGRAEVEVGDLNDYEPPSPVAATTVFRAIYYARDRSAFFRHVAEYTDKKAVFDLNPRQYRVDDVVRDLRAAGFSSIELRPFFVPQTVSLPRPVLAAAKALERSGPFARVALRWRFTYLVAAAR